MATGDLIRNLLSHAALPAAGAAAGGITGGIFSDEGATSRGILQGALLGGGTGVAGTLGLKALESINAPTLALLGTILGGGTAGLIGQRRVNPWSIEKMKIQELENLEKRRKLQSEDEVQDDGQTGPGSARNAVGALMEKTESAKETTMSIQDRIKEARVALGQTKKASIKKNAEFKERLNSFEFGMEANLKDQGFEKAAVAQAAGVTEAELAPRTLEWVTSQLDKQPTQ